MGTKRGRFRLNIKNLFRQAIILTYENCFEEAEQAFSQICNEDPDNPNSYTNLGVVLCHQGKIDAALSSNQYALSHDPKHGGAL